MRLFRFSLCVAWLVCAAGCASPGYVHCVMFTFKADAPAEAVRAMVAESTSEIERIPSVREVRCGLRDTQMTRSVNDTGFTVGLVVQFADRAGYDAFVIDPIHVALAERYRDAIFAICVFDFITGDGKASP